ncbi:MAG TPA: flagellar biosynthesis protein FlhF [Steroidobacteraceae bacterium]|nr:flagellar biosynthesis protein FlhF [Steroidobacteraceae bacterium]
MRIIRYKAPDTRQALRGIREQLGDDAVILSSKRTPEGVELTAAVDFDATRLENAAVPLAPRPAEPPAAPLRAAQAPAPAREPAALAPTPAADPAIASVAAQLRAPAAAAARAPAAQVPAAARAAAAARPAVARPAAPLTTVAPPSPARTAVPASAPVPAADAARAAVSAPAAVAAPAPAASAAAAAAMDNMNHELKILRRMLETQLEQLAWNERTRRTPVIAEMLRELTEMGISPELADRIVEQLPEQVDLASARRFAIAGLSQYLRTAGPRWQDDGGRVALVGATGVGKTTTLAKIAVRWVLRHGARDLALVAADPVRIGAHDQLHSLGQLLGAPVYAPDGFAGLPVLLAQLARYRLVLIDTPGSSVRDPQLAARLAVLANSASKLESALVLPANSQAGAIEESVRRFSPANPSCCLLTKVDEAASLGGVLSVLIRARLPVAYVSGGQRVPEDLQPARALELVSQAVQLAKATQATADEDLLRRRFGRNTHGST